MEFFHGVIALLSGIVLVLSGLVAWLYVQQSRHSQAINALAIALTTVPPSYPTAEEVIAKHEDDRVTVEDHDDHDEEDDDIEVSGEDMTDLKSKTVVQLREMLTEKGIPFNKSDKKGTLISLVQAAS
jgi:hypothetical protein